jgi:hypothetical protein
MATPSNLRRQASGTKLADTKQACCPDGRRPRISPDDFPVDTQPQIVNLDTYAKILFNNEPIREYNSNFPVFPIVGTLGRIGAESASGRDA